MRREVPSTRIRAHSNHFATIPSCGFYQLFFQSGAASYPGHASECLEHVRRRRGYRSVLIAIAAGLPSSGTKFQALATGADVCKPCPAQDRLASKAGSPRPRKFYAPRSSAEAVERVQPHSRAAPQNKRATRESLFAASGTPYSARKRCALPRGAKKSEKALQKLTAGTDQKKR